MMGRSARAGLWSFIAFLALLKVTPVNAMCANLLGYTASKNWLESAAKGEPLAQANAGDMYARGDGVAKDFAAAYALLKKSADQGCEQGEYGLAGLYFYGQGVDLDWSKYAYWVRKAAEKELPEAQHALGSILTNGAPLAGVVKNEAEALDWYMKAAHRGYAYAQWALGTMFIEGKGVEKNLIDGYYWWSIAALPDEKHAKSERARLREQMTSSQISIAESRIQDWREKKEFEEVKNLAEMGWLVPSPDAEFDLAWKYRKGQGTVKDDALAFKWFLKVAERGIAEAEFIVGILYKNGQGIAKDNANAFKWLKKAADQGHALSQANLGLIYASGDGVVKDDQLSVEWHQKAANQGNVTSQNNLGVAYEHGIGITKDAQSAYYWYLLAAAEGEKKALKNRDRIERILTPSEKANAQTAARDWKPGSSNQAAARTDTTTPIKPKPRATGSGFFVAPNRVVTNFHVIEGCTRLVVGGKGDAQMRASDVRNDLALLEVKNGSESIGTLREGKVRAGEGITAIGFPLAGMLAEGANITAGNVSALAGPRNDVRLIQITAPVQLGNSGGPLIDASGNVAGVVVSKLDTLKVAKATGDIPQNVNFAINVTMLQAFLDSSGTQYKVAALGSRLSGPDLAERGKKFTTLIECY